MVYFTASFYYVRYGILGQIIVNSYKRFQIRVWLLSVFFIFMFFLHQLLSLVFRLIDEIFFRGFKKVELKQPVFIISNPRSGTTYLHRLIALDEDRFIYTKFAHTFFMTTSFVKLYKAARYVDNKMLRGITGKTLDKLDEKFWGGWDNIHSLGFNKAEEDELVFAQMMMSTGVLIPFPFFDVINGNKFLDHEPADVRKKVMDFYESSVKRFIYGYGNDRTYLAKNVMSTGRFKTLIERFPDAKIIYLARHPYDAVPSMASMFTVMYNTPPLKNGDIHPAKKAWTRLAIDFYKYSKEMRKVVPEGQFMKIKYDDLLQKPEESVLKIYQHFNWEATEKFKQRLAAASRRNVHYKSTHEYSLEQYGLSKIAVYNELSDIMDEFGFEKEF
jgi:hypothetical protein